MREIKFRGRDKLDDGTFSEWLYGSLDLTEYRPIIRPIDDVPETVMPETVGQYTGLKDKNGVEIYEGDVISDGESDWVVVYLPHIARFVKACNEMKLSLGWDNVNYCEVIGNVFDNPDLKERFWKVWNQENLNQ